jgi:hypothetical protein
MRKVRENAITSDTENPGGYALCEGGDAWIAAGKWDVRLVRVGGRLTISVCDSDDPSLTTLAKLEVGEP